MPLLTGQYLTPNCFSWSAGTKKDGSKREAGEYIAFFVYSDGPTAPSSPVIEVQVPDEHKQRFQDWQVKLPRLAPVKIFVDFTQRGKARLLDWA